MSRMRQKIMAEEGYQQGLILITFPHPLSALREEDFLFHLAVGYHAFYLAILNKL